MTEILLAHKTEILLVAILVVTMLGTVFALLAFIAARRGPAEAPLGRVEAGTLLRQEGDSIRDAVDISASRLRRWLRPGFASAPGQPLAAAGSR